MAEEVVQLQIQRLGGGGNEHRAASDLTDWRRVDRPTGQQLWNVLGWVFGVPDINVLGVFGVVDDDDADSAVLDVFHVAHGMVVVEPDSCCAGPAEGVPVVVVGGGGVV